MSDLTIEGVRIVDVVTGAVTEPRTVVIEGDTIASIVPAPEPLEPRYLAPGLVDAHVHLVFDAGLDPIGSFRALDDEGRRRVALANARVAVEAGITTVRDLGAPLSIVAEVARTIARGDAPGPDVVYAGAAITRVGGHIGLFGGEVRDEREARALVERQVEAGARAVKLVVSGGGLTPGTRPDRAELPVRSSGPRSRRPDPLACQSRRTVTRLRRSRAPSMPASRRSSMPRSYRRRAPSCSTGIWRRGCSTAMLPRSRR